MSLLPGDFSTMTFRDTILIVEKGKTFTNSIESAIRKKEYFLIRVEKPDSFVPLLDSLDRIRALLFVDNDMWAAESYYANLRLLKVISRDLPLIFTTAKNSAEKEKLVRDLGVFYYHTTDEALNDLLTALECAVEKSVGDNLFLT